MVPDVVVAEVQELQGTALQAYRLQSVELSGEQVVQVQQLRIRYRRLSVNDLFALVLAQSLDALLLTGDEHLRKAATQEQINTHGTLWLLDEIVRLEIISTLQAAEALQRMIDGRRRLPLTASEMRLRLWTR